MTRIGAKVGMKEEVVRGMIFPLRVRSCPSGPILNLELRNGGKRSSSLGDGITDYMD
jgi:hypothetical protein